MRNWIRTKFQEEKGAALALVAATMVVLLGMAAFGSDLGWFYLNASRVQRGADAAALGGVIWMPGDLGQAGATAVDIAYRNGYDTSLAEVDVTPEAVPGKPNQLRVTVTAIVPTFFAKIFGFAEMEITRTAIAEYIPPLRLGSPFATMGNDPNCFSPPSASNPCSGNFWIGIYGTHINSSNGDPFSSFCNGGAPSSGCTTNPLYRTDGYLFGIVPTNASLTIQGLDPQHRYDGGSSSGYGDQHRTGDNKMGPADEPGPTTTYNLYEPDPTPEVVSDNGPPICTRTYASVPQIDPDQDPPFSPPDPSWVWENICTGVPVTPGALYVLQVLVEGPGSDDDGSNRFSLRVGGGAGKVFGIRDFSVYFNSDLATSFMYLAEVPDDYAGKTFVVEGFDPGDVGDEGTLQLRYPTGPGVWNTFPSCRWYIKDSVDDPTWAPKGTLSPCSVVADNGEPLSSDENFQNKWFKLEADLPPSYSCANCWWQMWYVFPPGAAPSDHVTWRAYVKGNPIHLVPSS